MHKSYKDSFYSPDVFRGFVQMKLCHVAFYLICDCSLPVFCSDDEDDDSDDDGKPQRSVGKELKKVRQTFLGPFINLSSFHRQ